MARQIICVSMLFTYSHKDIEAQPKRLYHQDIIVANKISTVFLIDSQTLARGIPRWFSCKESTCQCRRCEFHPWVGKISQRRLWQPTPVFLPGESHGQRSLAGYSPWGHKELDMTELTQHTSMQNKRTWDSVSTYTGLTPPGELQSNSGTNPLEFVQTPPPLSGNSVLWKTALTSVARHTLGVPKSPTLLTSWLRIQEVPTLSSVLVILQND